MGLKNLILVMIFLTVSLDLLIAETTKETEMSPRTSKELALPKLDKTPCDKENVMLYVSKVTGSNFKFKLIQHKPYPCHSLLVSTDGQIPVHIELGNQVIILGTPKNIGQTEALLTNREIIKLTKVLPEELVILIIKVTRCNFNLTNKGVRSLKRHNISESIIKAMANREIEEKTNERFGELFQ